MGTRHHNSLKRIPKKLEWLIEYANAVEHYRLLSFDEVFAQVENEWSEESEFEEFARIHSIDVDDSEIYMIVKSDFKASTLFHQASKALKMCLKNAPQKFTEYIYEDAEFDSEIDRLAVATARYEAIRVACEQLQHLAQFSKPALQNIERFTHSHRSFDSSGMLVTDAQGIIRFKDSLFREVVEGIEAARIRVCEVCGRIFWAGRITQKGCTNRCAHKYRVRKSRELQKKREEEFIAMVAKRRKGKQ